MIEVSRSSSEVAEKYPRRHTIIKGFDNLWEADLGEFQPYERENRGNRYILFVMDYYSNYLWTRPVKRKNADDLSIAMLDIPKIQK